MCRYTPEKLTGFAFRLANVGKAVTLMGTLVFIFATVVLLGGLVATLPKIDFWFVFVIAVLVFNGTGIFRRSHELEWQHQSTWSITDVGFNSFLAMKMSSSFVIRKLEEFFRQSSPGDDCRKISTPAEDQRVGQRTWRNSEVPLFPLMKWMFMSKNISRFLYWLQPASSVTCLVLSMLRLFSRNYGLNSGGDSSINITNTALIIFYSLTLSHALVVLTARAYWEWKVRGEKLFEKVNNECELGPFGLVLTRSFFYYSYSKCIDGSISDSRKIDMVSFSMKLLDSNSHDEQLMGATILRKFSTNSRFLDDTLQKIGTNILVISRLLEMLNWKDVDEELIRYSAAEIVESLAGKVQNSLRIAELPGGMESISSLLYISCDFTRVSDHISEKTIISDTPLSFNQLGLQILEKLARNRDICGKIGNTKGLLLKIIDFMHAEEPLLRQTTTSTSQILTVKLALQVIKLLSTTSGKVGKHLRKEISDTIFTVTYIRDILKHGDNQPELQLLAIEILINLAIEEDATEKVGGTGGVLRVLLSIFFNVNMLENRSSVRSAAGEALAMLSLNSKNICHHILKLKHNHDLVKTLKDPILRVNSAKILRNLYAYRGSDCTHHLHGLTAAAPVILEAIMNEENKLQEVMIGAAARLFKFMDEQEATDFFKNAEIKESCLVHHLFSILKRYKQPSIEVPGIRRYTIELCIWMMRNNEGNIRSFESLGMAMELESVVETTSELESFNIFCGAVGVYRHRVEMDSLVKTALELLQLPRVERRV